MKNKELGIIGTGHIGHSVAESELVAKVLAEKGIGDIVNVILVNTPEPDDSFEINGIKYAPIKKEPKNPSNSKSGILRQLVEYMPINYGWGGGNNTPRTLPSHIDIVTEYGLIELKQSKLTKWERDEVIRVFNKTYYKL
jgi:hypothetical protein